MTLSALLGVALAAVFGVLGLMNFAALPPARKLAADLQYSVSSYRMIGALQLAAAIGLVLALFTSPQIGGLAGAGLLMLMGAGVGAHLQNGDPIAKTIPAIILGVITAGYVVALTLPI